MSNQHKQISMAPEGGKRAAPVRVQLRRIGADQADPIPPDGIRPEWWERLKDALGTCSSDFVRASMLHLVAACRLPRTGISEVAVNAALALIEGARPQNEVEAALLIQMAATHSATMGVFSRFHGDFGGEHSMAVGANAVSRLLRAYATQVETLRRLRNGGTQVVRVEHVHIEAGAKAVIGVVPGA